METKGTETLHKHIKGMITLRTGEHDTTISMEKHDTTKANMMVRFGGN